MTHTTKLKATRFFTDGVASFAEDRARCIESKTADFPGFLRLAIVGRSANVADDLR
jgi:hypothetical protein